MGIVGNTDTLHSHTKKCIEEVIVRHTGVQRVVWTGHQTVCMLGLVIVTCLVGAASKHGEVASRTVESCGPSHKEAAGQEDTVREATHGQVRSFV
jgi:hypothetical protein